MLKQFVIELLSKDGKEVKIEVKQRSSEIISRKIKTWTSEEDNKLLQLYEKYPKRWNEISACMDNRNDNQCLQRHRRLTHSGKTKIWSSQEDAAILKLTKKYGKNWRVISEMLSSKTPKQVRQRFINKLDPTIKKEEWSEDQDKKVLQLYMKIGSKWSEISRSLPGRPENHIKNRFYSFIRRYYDIRSKQLENLAPSLNQLKNVGKHFFSEENDKIFKPVNQNVAQVSEKKAEQREDLGKTDENVLLKQDLPSINEIEQDIKNENLVNNPLQSQGLPIEQQWKTVIHNYQDWRSISNYHSIFSFNSDAHFKHHF